MLGMGGGLHRALERAPHLPPPAASAPPAPPQVPLIWVTELLKRKAGSDHVGNMLFWVSFCFVGQVRPVRITVAERGRSALGGWQRTAERRAAGRSTAQSTLSHPANTD